MLEEYQERIQNAKDKQFRIFERFHIGDCVYPFWLNGVIVYGTVIDIDTVARKIICDFNGVVRQFQPEDLMHLNPDFAKARKSFKKKKAIYYAESPSKYKMSEDEKETGKIKCNKCGEEMEPSFNPETKESAYVCKSCDNSLSVKKVVSNKRPSYNNRVNRRRLTDDKINHIAKKILKEHF